MSKTSTRIPSSDHLPRGLVVSLALHDARPASAHFAGLGGGCWPWPRPAPLASGAPVIDHRRRPTADRDRFPGPPREGRVVATVRNAFHQPGAPSRGPSLRRRAAAGDLGACSPGRPEGSELDLVPRLSHEPGLLIGHHRLASAARTKSEHTWRTSSTSPEDATSAPFTGERVASVVSDPPRGESRLENPSKQLARSGTEATPKAPHASAVGTRRISRRLENIAGLRGARALCSERARERAPVLEGMDASAEGPPRRRPPR